MVVFGLLRFIFSMMFLVLGCVFFFFKIFFNLFLEKQLSDGLGNVLRIWWVIVNGIVPYIFWKLQKAT